MRHELSIFARAPRSTPCVAAALRLLAFVMGLAVTSVDARESDLTQPIEIDADRSEYDERAGIQILEGNVRISQGTILITADRIEVQLEDGRLASIDGTGSPLGFAQDNEAGERMRGSADSLAYDAISGSLILEGNATLEQPRQRLVSDRIVFDTISQTVRAEGNQSDSDSNRVRIRIEPPERPNDKP